MNETQAQHLLSKLRRAYCDREFSISGLLIDHDTAAWLAEELSVVCVYWPDDDDSGGYYRFGAYMRLPVEPDIAVAQIARLLDDPGRQPTIIHQP